MRDDWRQNPKWQQPIYSTAGGKVKGAWFFATFWALVSSPVLFVVPEEINQGNMAALLAFIFPIVGLFLFYWAYKLTRERKKYGTTPLTLDPYPGSIGGQVGGTILLPMSAGQEATYRVTLCCRHSYVQRTGKNSRRREKTLWESSGPADCKITAGGTEVQFCFDVPDQLPESEEASRAYHYWALIVEGDQSKVPFSRTFQIPVFATRTAAKFLATNTNLAARDEAEAEVDHALSNPLVAARLREKLGLSLEVRAQWIRLYFHSGRQKATSAILLTVGLPFLAVFWFLPNDDFFTGIFRYVFGLAGLLMLIAAFYIPLNSLDVRISEQKISRIRKWLGIAFKSQTISPREIQHLEIQSSGSTQTGDKKVTFYKLVGKGEFGKFRFAESIDDRALLEALEAKIREYAGLNKAVSD